METANRAIQENGSSSKLSRGHLTAWHVLAWNSRAVSVAISVVLLMQITYYSTEVVGLSAALVGTIFLVSKAFDGITDLIVGFIIDKTNTRLGKARPYELFIIPLWLLIVFLFSTPDMNTTGKIIYIFVFYTLINSVCSTFLQSSETVYLGRAVQDDGDRAKILAIGGVIVMLISAVSSMILPQLMNSWGALPGGWTKIALVYAVPMSIIGLLRFIFIKEKTINNEKRNNVGFTEGLKLLIKNKYIFILSILILLSFLSTNIISITGTYYFRFIMGDLGLLSLVGMMGLLGPFLFLLFPLALRKIGSIGFVRIGFTAAAIVCVIRFFFYDNLMVLVISSFLSGVGLTSITMINHFFILQCIEYGELKTGKRVEGTPAALTNFANKIGSAIASGSAGFIMTASGYVSSASVQPDGALMSIRLLYSLVPATLSVIMLIILRFFDVEETLKSMKKERTV
ncbi:MAG: MFS transporter [Spirochaetaceae bacterium]|jgi:GPH family glycoside/pentoside/hexuronide:cation symporter|nr:MFS transporter [Spirochaetaceae bacterium]